MLNERPGAYIFLGNGDSTELHTDTYDFNDEAIPVGVSYWVRLVEKGAAVDVSALGLTRKINLLPDGQIV